MVIGEERIESDLLHHLNLSDGTINSFNVIKWVNVMSSSDQMNTLYPTYHIHVLTFLAVRPLNDIHVFLSWQHLVKKTKEKR